ncbi:MAG: DUF1579 family protein [Planctomycetes bacterium]|nr:DUF1579 family protein [Planctomycetota bacterium]
MVHCNTRNIALCGVIFFLSIYSIAATPTEVPAQTMARMEKLGKAFATPNENHKFLARLTGDWDTATSVIGLPNETGFATFSMILGNRFVNGDVSGTLANLPYVGRVTIGYDNYKHKFVASFLNDLGTSMLYAEGMLDRSGNTLSLWGTMDEWMTDEHDIPAMYRFAILDDNHFTFELHDLAKTKDPVVISTSYTRMTQK